MKHNGFTLIELLITITVVNVGIAGALIAIQQGIGAIDYSNSRFTAALLAQEGVEIVKNIRDTNLLEYNYVSETISWSNNFDPGGVGMERDYEVQYTDVGSTDPSLSVPTCSPSCDFYSLSFLKKTADGFYNYDSGDATKFKRRIHIQKAIESADRIKIEVIVYWRKRGGGVSALQLSQEIYNWW